MTSPQDVVNDDLRRLMSDEPQDNLNEVCSVVKDRLVTDQVKVIPLARQNRNQNLFSDNLNKKISRARPEYMVRLIGLLAGSFAFGIMAAISVVIVDYPYDIVLMLIVLAPFIIAVVKRGGYGKRTTHNKK